MSPERVHSCPQPSSESQPAPPRPQTILPIEHSCDQECPPPNLGGHADERPRAPHELPANNLKDILKRGVFLS
jgi:hypothetical protein